MGLGDIVGSVLGAGGAESVDTKVPEEFTALLSAMSKSGINLAGLLGGQNQLAEGAFGQLGQLLGQKGQIDPALMNQQLAGIARGTNTQQDAAAANVRGSGLQNSGVGAALQAAIGAAGADRSAGRIAQEHTAAAGRQRGDINSILQAIINPQLGLAGQGTAMAQSLLGSAQQDAAQATGVNLQNQMSQDALMGSLISGGAMAGSAGLKP